MITFFAPAWRCFSASSRLVNRPEHSSTTSTPCSRCASSAGVRFAETAIFLPLMTTASSVASTVPSKIPCTESYLKRCASVFGLSTSLIRTTSKVARRLIAARRVLRPILPKPLMAKRAMCKPPGGGTHRLGSGERQASRQTHSSARPTWYSLEHGRYAAFGERDQTAFGGRDYAAPLR